MHSEPIAFRRGIVVGTLAAVPLFVLPFALFVALYGPAPLVSAIDSDNGLNMLLLATVLGCVVHELLHGFGFWKIAKLPWRGVEFGIKWRFLTPYATTKVPMDINAYRWSVALPGLVLGVLPLLVAIPARDIFWTSFAAMMLSGAGGDAVVLWHIRDIPAATIVRDASNALGCEVVQAA